MIHHARQLINLAGLAPYTDERTPERVARTYCEYASRATAERPPGEHLNVTFPPPKQPTIIAATADITTLCSHHLLPVWGRAVVAYLPYPGQRIVGLSKLVRCLHGCAARPGTQEELGASVVELLGKHLDPEWSGVAIRATHACMALRGANAGPSSAVTTIVTDGSQPTAHKLQAFTDAISRL